MNERKYVFKSSIKPKQEEFNALRRFVGRLNAVVLPNQEFSIKTGITYIKTFRGKLIINKFRIYRSSLNHRLHLVVDITVSGYCVLHRCIRRYDQIQKVINQKRILGSYYRYSSKIIFTRSYHTQNKIVKREIEINIIFALRSFIKDLIKTYFLKEQIDKYGFIADMNYGIIRYE